MPTGRRRVASPVNGSAHKNGLAQSFTMRTYLDWQNEGVHRVDDLRILATVVRV